MRILLSRLVNAKEDTDLVETLRALFMTPLDDADLGMINNPTVVDKVQECKERHGDVGVRASLLLNRWTIACGADLNRRRAASSTTRSTGRPECDVCGRTYSNRANLVRHQRAEHDEEESTLSQQASSSKGSEEGGIVFLFSLFRKKLLSLEVGFYNFTIGDEVTDSNKSLHPLRESSRRSDEGGVVFF